MSLAELVDRRLDLPPLVSAMAPDLGSAFDGSVGRCPRPGAEQSPDAPRIFFRACRWLGALVTRWRTNSMDRRDRGGQRGRRWVSRLVRLGCDDIARHPLGAILLRPKPQDHGPSTRHRALTLIWFAVIAALAIGFGGLALASLRGTGGAARIAIHFLRPKHVTFGHRVGWTIPDAEADSRRIRSSAGPALGSPRRDRRRVGRLTASRGGRRTNSRRSFSRSSVRSTHATRSGARATADQLVQENQQRRGRADRRATDSSAQGCRTGAAKRSRRPLNSPAPSGAEFLTDNKPRIAAPDGAGEGATEHRKRAHLGCVSAERRSQRAPAPSGAALVDDGAGLCSRMNCAT